MKLRALIVDDEYLARQELRFLLEQFRDIEIWARRKCHRSAQAHTGA